MDAKNSEFSNKPNKPDGIFSNGDLWFNERNEEDGKTWFIAYPVDDMERPYETLEIPERFPLFTMVRFNEGTPEKVVNDYFNSDFNTQYAISKNIGDRRFGSECKHERAKRGYCPDCLRKII